MGTEKRLLVPPSGTNISNFDGWLMDYIVRYGSRRCCHITGTLWNKDGNNNDGSCEKFFLV